jgi:hypothetical protein
MRCQNELLEDAKNLVLNITTTGLQAVWGFPQLVARKDIDACLIATAITGM